MDHDRKKQFLSLNHDRENAPAVNITFSTKAKTYHWIDLRGTWQGFFLFFALTSCLFFLVENMLLIPVQFSRVFESATQFIFDHSLTFANISDENERRMRILLTLGAQLDPIAQEAGNHALKATGWSFFSLGFLVLTFAWGARLPAGWFRRLVLAPAFLAMIAGAAVFGLAHLNPDVASVVAQNLSE